MSRNRLFSVLSMGTLGVASAVWLSQPSAVAQSFPARRGSSFSHLAPQRALFLWVGHCDTLDGPVVTAARNALNAKNVNLVLIWVQPKDEPEIKLSFQQALEVRKLGGKAKALADKHFFETLVRVHRAGEGAPFWGLKPAGTPVEAAVAEADRALSTGSVEPLVKALTREVEEGVRLHFKKAMQAKRYAPNDVKAGRQFVKAYVEYVHFSEGIGAAAAGPAHGHYPEEHAGG